MKKLVVDFDEIQKAMEDTERDAFEYFLDKETGNIVILSQEIISRAYAILDEEFDEDLAEYEEVEFDEEYAVPDWMEDEIELALDIFINEKERYVRIPERLHRDGYNTMKEFCGQLENKELSGQLMQILDGKGAFRRFKDALETYPRERKSWYAFNAKIAKKEIENWLKSIGIEQRPDS
ncbi:MAG: hypothetical protein HZA17_12790 [Nitrospirae bacterium]|nr:hypothetical protein [Nitrospirota bacterium]